MSTPTTTHRLPAEPDAHALSRHFRTGVRILLAASLIGTCVSLLFFSEVAYLAAIPIPFLYAVLAFVNYLEVRSRATELRERGPNRLTKEEIDADVETAGVILMLKVLGVLAAAAFIIAAAFFEWQYVGIIASGLFFLAVLINTPYLPLFFAEAKQDELDHLRSDKQASE
ncbi:hypothetical protein [Rhodopirellula islandica]|uniref:hypothetical protein n=1 Tax=Rhodopirellula islandica TaxID=595434 RepID=UPI001F3995ED|nr:hypothetical protein [Rhodopirellula islandica]